jgi:hypothetical protein
MHELNWFLNKSIEQSKRPFDSFMSVCVVCVCVPSHDHLASSHKLESFFPLFKVFIEATMGVEATISDDRLILPLAAPFGETDGRRGHLMLDIMI